jgi:hypothetical protein
MANYSVPTTTLDERRDLLQGTMRSLLDKRADAARGLNQLEMQLEYMAYDLMSKKDDPQHVEKYDGTLGVPRQFVDDYQRPVGQLRWLDLTEKFAAEDRGTLSGQKWGSGALIGDDLFLTAGHCFAQVHPGWEVPQRNGMPISQDEIARLMCVCFNYQINGKTGETRTDVCFPVVELVECFPSAAYPDPNLDFAIVRLGRDEEQGLLPGKVFGSLKVAKQDLTTRNSILCIIQHPNRKEKKVEAGHLLDIREGRIAYNDIGTIAGSSGAPILDGSNGEIVGVHVKGGSLPIGGFNSGTAIGAIRHNSKILDSLC